MQNVGLHWKRKLYLLLRSELKTALEGFRFPEQTWRCCRTLIRLSPWVLLSSLTFTLIAVASQGLGVRMGPEGLMWGWAGTSLEWPHHSQPPSQGSSAAGEVQGGRTSRGTQLKSDILSLGLRSCCSFRPNTNSAERLEVSQHAGTQTASTVGLLCLIPLWHQRTLQSVCNAKKTD